MDDNIIIEKLKNQDEDGFVKLIDRYCNYVSAIICNLSHGKLSGEDVEELCADVFLLVWKSRENLHPCETLKPYLAQIARNTTWSRLRKSGEEWIPFDDDILTVSVGGPDELAETRDQSKIINEAVADFPEPEQEIFIRFYFFGESLKVISNRLSLHPACVKTKLYRCRKRLKSIFEERGYER